MTFYTMEDVASPPEYFNFATDVVDRWAEQDPDLLALRWISDNSAEPLDLSYRHFSVQSKKAARLLQDLGAEPGDRVMVVLNRVPAWWEIATAVIRAGLVLCPCPSMATAKDIEFRLQSSGASIFVGNKQSLTSFSKVRSKCPGVKAVLQADGSPVQGFVQYKEAIEQVDTSPFLGHRTKSQDPALVYFTSGTTGLPKMVLHTQVSYPLAHVSTATHWLQLSKNKTYWNLSEQGWAKAAWSWFSTWNAGATLFVHDSDKPFSAENTLQILHKYPITTFCAPPTAYRQLVTAQMQNFISSHRPKALAICTAGGEPLNDAVIETWKAMTGIEIRDGYGQTETILLVCNRAGLPIKPGSMGKPVPGVPVEVIDEDGKSAKVGQEGDIAVLAMDSNGKRLPFIYTGYISKDGSLTRKSRPRTDAKGLITGEWYMTGDRAYRDSDGYLWFVGRSDDIIKSSGYRIGPFEVESTLKLHPAVIESAVVGVEDAQRGELVKAFVVLDPAYEGADPVKLKKELQDHCKREAAPYKYPRQIQFVKKDWLPKTISGKIKRADLRKWEKSNNNRASI